MRKHLQIIILILTICSSALADYVSVALPKSSELNDLNKFYDASIAINKLSDNEVQNAVTKILSASQDELKNLVANKSMANKAAKFLKLARLDKSVKILPTTFGKWKIALFEIPPNSRMRKGMNYFAFEQIGNKLLWDLSVNNMYLALMSQCNIANPQPIDVTQIHTFSASDKTQLNDIIKNKQPILIFKNGALISVNAVSNVKKHPAAKFYKKIQDVFFSWKIEQYAQFMSPKSKAKFNSQYSGMSEEQKKSTLSDYFSWKKKYLKVMQLSDNEYLLIFKRQKQGQNDQYDVAYLTLTSKDGSTGYLEKFGERTPLDLMLSRHFFK